MTPMLHAPLRAARAGPAGAIGLGGSERARREAVRAAVWVLAQKDPGATGPAPAHADAALRGSGALSGGSASIPSAPPKGRGVSAAMLCARQGPQNGPGAPSCGVRIAASSMGGGVTGRKADGCACASAGKMFTTLWMWRQEYQHHEQLPLAFNGTWPSWNSDLDNRPW